MMLEEMWFPGGISKSRRPKGGFGSNPVAVSRASRRKVDKMQGVASIGDYRDNYCCRTVIAIISGLAPNFSVRLKPILLSHRDRLLWPFLGSVILDL